MEERKLLSDVTNAVILSRIDVERRCIKMENSIINARELYENKNYKQALDMCFELVEDNRDKKDAYLIIAKSFLFLLDSPLNEDKNKAFLDAYTSACVYAQTAEALNDIRSDIGDAFNKWKDETIRFQIKKLESNPSLQNFRKYIYIFPEYARLKIDIFMYDSNAVKLFCERNAIEQIEFSKNYPLRETSKAITDEEISALEYISAQNIFEKTKSKLVDAADGNADYVVYVGNIALDELFTVHSMIDRILQKKEIDSEKKCEYLKFKAVVLEYKLNAVIYPNGRPISLFLPLNSRAKDIEKLKGAYAEISRLDPNFTHDSIPDVEPINSPSIDVNANSGSGGCYVATAVYGSYDCPEVWTLRRFRDYTLAETWYGRFFVRTYYKLSPVLVKWFGKSNWFKKLWKPVLDKIVKKLNCGGVANTPYNDRNW